MRGLGRRLTPQTRVRVACRSHPGFHLTGATQTCEKLGMSEKGLVKELGKLAKKAGPKLAKVRDNHAARVVQVTTGRWGRPVQLHCR